MKTFKYTDEQLKAIYEGDIFARNTFFFDNLDIITCMAQSALNRENHLTVTIDDLIQGVYIDMDYFCHGVDRPVTNNVEIAGFMRWSFHLAPYGGLAHCRIYNQKVGCPSYQGYFNPMYTDNNFVRLDSLMRENSEKRGTSDFYDYVDTDNADELDELGSVEDTEQYEDNTDEYVKVFGQYLTPKQLEVFALMLDGYTDTRIAEKLGLKLGAVGGRRRELRAKFVKQLPDVLQTLKAYGIDADGIADRTPKCFYKMSEEQRAYHRENHRKNKARRRAEKIPHDVA